MNKIKQAVGLFKKRYEVEQKLKKLGIVRTHRFTGDYGEWLASMIFNGNLATNPNEVDWDIIVKHTKYQVKTHHKAETNKSNYSLIKSLDYPVLIFTLKSNYMINNIYSISPKKLSELESNGTLKLKDKKYRLRWSDCKNITDKFKVNYSILFQ